VPRVPDALELATPAVDRAQFRAALDRGMRRFRAGEILADTDWRAMARQADAMFDDLDNLLAGHAAGDGDLADFWHDIMEFIGKAGDRYGYTESFIAGTLRALPRIAMFYCFRVADGEKRRALFGRFIAEFRAIGAEMRGKTRALIESLDNPRAGAASAG
jgi:hypothetical protein